MNRCVTLCSVWAMCLAMIISLEGCKVQKEIMHLEVAAFETAIQVPGVHLLDVRTAEEYAGGHIKRAQNVDVKRVDFAEVVQRLYPDKEQIVYVYCQSGLRSMKAAHKLTDAGYKVGNLEGGFAEWMKTGKPVAKD